MSMSMSMTEEIQQVLASWALGYDERDVPRMVDCFTPDATMVLNIGGTEILGPFEGRDAVIGHMTEHHAIQEDQRRHVVTNPVVEPVSEHEAKVTSYLTLLVTDGDGVRLQATGVYRDRFVRGDRGWRIAYRHLDLDTHY
jgi:ketosteroid isomerase-like protein